MPNQSVIQIEAIQNKLPHLDKLCLAKNEATTEFNEAIKAVAQDARVEASVLKAYVNAIVDAEKLEKHKANAAQLTLLFEELA